ncbi:hypothetical protein M2336_003225 [Sphingobium sp. B1D7B]|nr:hypothetical protein [Sphingobium sp. B11D3A]MCW2406596.1 hypothetical protein [Sphingobium sp. B1D7B]
MKRAAPTFGAALFMRLSMLPRDETSRSSVVMNSARRYASMHAIF